ncbi:Uncharacterised protein [Mycobacteroides abscessus subsp. abscessus]|nr:Uncharacterised protein [Mycobacteroides abscessus subsp. abscessus]
MRRVPSNCPAPITNSTSGRLSANMPCPSVGSGTNSMKAWMYLLISSAICAPVRVTSPSTNAGASALRLSADTSRCPELMDPCSGSNGSGIALLSEWSPIRHFARR